MVNECWKHNVHALHQSIEINVTQPSVKNDHVGQLFRYFEFAIADEM